MGRELKAAHFVITDSCRATHGDGEAVIDETLRRLRVEMLQSLKGWTPGKGTQFHVRWAIERADPETKPGA